MWFALIAAAWADTLQLDNGAVLVGQLAAYDRAGECRIEISQGELAGASVVVPCSRITRFEREKPAAFVRVGPPPAPAPAPAPAAPPPEPVVEAAIALPAAPPPVMVPEIPVEIVDHPTEIPEDVEVPVDAVSEEDEEPPARGTHWLDNLPTFSDPFRK
jgi:hypothetical protein